MFAHARNDTLHLNYDALQFLGRSIAVDGKVSKLAPLGCASTTQLGLEMAGLQSDLFPGGPEPLCSHLTVFLGGA